MPATFRACQNTTTRSVVSFPKSYLFSPPTLPGLFSIGVVPSANVTLLLNDSVLSVNASTAFFFASAPLAISVRMLSLTVKPIVTIRTSPCDNNTTVFSSAVQNASDWLVAHSIADSLALRASLRPGRRVRGLFCSPSKHYYAVGVRATTIAIHFDGFAIFSLTADPPTTAVFLYLVPESGGSGVSRVVALNSSALAQPTDVLLSHSVAPVEDVVLVIAASVPLAYSFSFSIADCLMGDDSTPTLAFGARVVGSICPAGDHDTFIAPIHAGNFTLTIDVGELSAPLALKAVITIFENSEQRAVVARPECVLDPLVAVNVTQCAWAVDQSDGFLSVDLSIDNISLSPQTLASYGVSLGFVPRATLAPTPTAATTTYASTPIAVTTLASVITPSVEETVPESTDVAMIAGIVGGAVVLLAMIGVAVAVGLRRRGKRASTNEVPMVTPTTTGSASIYGVAPPAKNEAPVRTSEYGPISARGEYESMRADSHYATSVVDVKNLGGSNYDALTAAEGGTQ